MKGIKGFIIIAELKLEMAKHIKPLYITALLDGQPIPRILVNNGAAVNIFPARIKEIMQR